MELVQDYVTIDDKKIEIVTDKDTSQSYFAGRVELKGELSFGLVKKGQTTKISLSENNIKTPISIDSIIALSGETTADEIIFDLYRIIDGREIRVGVQRFSNSEMPYDFPDGIIYPDMIIGARPVRADATIQVVCKPIISIFRAIPEP